MLVSNTEKSPFIRALGKASRKPEEFGCDVLTVAGGKWLGFQRKAVADLVASMYDGRIAMERTQWNHLLDLGGRVVLVIEGKLTWTREWRKAAHPTGLAEGTEEILAGLHGKPIPRRNLNRFLFSIGKQGIIVAYTDNERHTAELIEDFVAYETEPRTGSRIPARPGPRGRWGKPTSREWQVWVLTSLGPNIGAKRAEDFLDHFDGRIPAKWEVGYEDILAVKGLGEKVADTLWAALGGDAAAAKMEMKERKKRETVKRRQETRTAKAKAKARAKMVQGKQAKAKGKK